MENNIKVKVYHEENEFLDSVKNFDVSFNPYLSYAFLSVFLKYFKAKKYYFFNIYEGGDLIGIVPFECTFESALLNVKKIVLSVIVNSTTSSIFVRIRIWGRFTRCSWNIWKHRSIVPF